MAGQKIEDSLINNWKSDEKRTLLDIASRGKYKSSKDIPKLTEINREKIHTALLAAGMTPGIGNIADAADALLYAAEGEFGSAGLSAAAMTPMVGQLVSTKRALKAAKKSGEEMVTVYRGVPKWFKGKMVKEGKFVGKGWGGALWASNSVDVAKRYSTRAERMAPEYKKHVLGKAVSKPTILEFEVPKSYIKKHTMLKHISHGFQGGGESFIFKEGLPKEFLKKVHR